jgi:hypothetical protein
MPNYANPLYANGVPTYSNEVGALGEVFKALAPNPLRDLQIQGYASNARLHQLQGDVIQTKQDMLPKLAQALAPGGRLQDAASIAASGGDLEHLPQVLQAASGQYGFRALDPGGLANVDPRIQATLSGAVGQNVANTMYGFDKTSDEIANNHRQESLDRRYGDDQQLVGTKYSADSQAGVGYDRNRRYSTAEANTLAQTVANNAQESKDRHYTSDNTLTGTKYTADRNYNAKIYDTDHDYSKGSRGSAVKIDPAKLDDAMLQSLPGSYKDDKGRWQTDPSVSAGDLAEARVRLAAYVRQHPDDQYGAVQMAISDVFGKTPNVTPEATHWYKPNEPLQVNALPADQRPPLPNLAQQFLAPTAAPAALPAPAAPAAPAAPQNPLLAEAAAAISSGAPRDKVIQRLRSMGVNEQELQGL